MKTPPRRPPIRGTDHQQALEAIQRGEVDAVVIAEETGLQLYALHPLSVPYQQLFESLPDSVLVLDDNGQITMCTPAFCRLTGAAAPVAAKAALRDYIDELALPIFDDVLARARISAAQAEVTLRGSSGTLRVRLALSPLPSAGFPDGGAEDAHGGFVAIVTEHGSRDSGRAEQVLTERVQDVVSGIASARSEDRAHVSEQMNDVVLPALIDVEADLQWIDEKLRWTDARPDAAVFARLRGVRDRIGDLTSRARRFDPPLLRLGIARALEARAKQLNGQSGVELHIAFDGGADAVDRVDELRLYRVVDQLVVGVVMSGNASRVDIGIERTDGSWQITSRDNGTREAAQRDPRRASVLNTIRDYVSAFGGYLHVRAPGDRGTVVHIAFPAGDATTPPAE